MTPRDLTTSVTVARVCGDAGEWAKLYKMSNLSGSDWWYWTDK